MKIDVNTPHFEISSQTTEKYDLQDVCLSQNKSCTWVFDRKIDIVRQKTSISSFFTSNSALHKGGAYTSKKIKDVNL